MVDSTRNTHDFSFRPRPATAQRMVTHMTPTRGGPHPLEGRLLNDMKELFHIVNEANDETLRESVLRQLTEKESERPIEKRSKAARRREEETERPLEKKRVMALRKRRRKEETECPAEQADEVQRKRRREGETERPLEKKRVMALRKRRREEEKECPAEQADEVQRKRRREEETERPVEKKRVMALRKRRREEEIECPAEQADEVQRKRRREEETERPVEKKRVMALRKRRREKETECPAEQADEVQRKRRREKETERPVEKKRVMALRKRRREEGTECPAEQADEVQRKRRREEKTERPVEKKRVMALRKRRREEETECPTKQADEVQRKKRREEETERPIEKRAKAPRKRRREAETECPTEQADKAQRKKSRMGESERPVERRAKAQRRREEEAEKEAKAPRKRSREKAEKRCKALGKEEEAKRHKAQMRKEEQTERPVKKRCKAPGKREEETESPVVKRGKALVKRKKKAENPAEQRHKASGKREERTESPVEKQDKTLQNKGKEEKIKMLTQTIKEQTNILSRELKITLQNEERMEKESRVPGCLYPESFIFHKLLGSGCHGQVMLATHCDSGKLVAIKISGKLYLTYKDRDAIMNERQVMQMVMGNPYCSKLYATFQTEDHLYYVMEFCSGGELRKQMEPKKLCDLPTMRLLAAELLCALQWVHSKGIIHSDVNPENILLDCKGHVRLSDFGNAVTNMFGSKTTTGKCGTDSYLAPEIFKDEPYDKAVDYFALGVILFEAAFGIYPFNIENPQASICHESPRYPICADDVLVNFLNKLLCKDQKKRKAYVAKMRNHRFFRGINWEQLEAGETRAPFSACRKDLKEEMMKTTILLTQTTLNVYNSLKYGGKYSRKTQERFKGFTFVSDEWKAIQNLKTKNTKS